MNDREIVIITGSSGFIGSAVIDTLSERFTLVGFDRETSPHPPAAAECVCIDVTSTESIEAALKRMQDDGLISISLPVEGCICFPKVIGVEDTNTLSKWLISNHGVVVVPGECFGKAGYVRIGFALNDITLAEALKRLATGLAQYRAITEKRSQMA